MNKKYQPAYSCDLHCHTVRSDGADTPQELIENAVSMGLKAAAITDHDTPPPKVLANGLSPKEYAQQKGLYLILGYEFSTDTFVDDVHIIGYELDWEKQELQNEVKRARKSKTEAYRKLCEVLTEHGMPIDYEKEILKYKDQKGNQQERKPDEVERKFVFEKMADKGYAPTWEDAKIMVRDNPKLNVRRRKINPLDAINLIHDCGGIAVLAHPYLIDKEVAPKETGEMTRELYIERLIDNNLDGIEARYTYDKTSYKGSKSVCGIEREINEKYKDKLLISGGSDYHAGHKKNRENPRKLGEAGISFKAFKNNFLDIL